MKILFVFLFFVFLFSSCNPVETNDLNNQIVKFTKFKNILADK